MWPGASFCLEGSLKSTQVIHLIHHRGFGAFEWNGLGGCCMISNSTEIFKSCSWPWPKKLEPLWNFFCRSINFCRLVCSTMALRIFPVGAIVFQVVLLLFCCIQEASDAELVCERFSLRLWEDCYVVSERFSLACAVSQLTLCHFSEQSCVARKSPCLFAESWDLFQILQSWTPLPSNPCTLKP